MSRKRLTLFIYYSYHCLQDGNHSSCSHSTNRYSHSHTQRRHSRSRCCSTGAPHGSLGESTIYFFEFNAGNHLKRSPASLTQFYAAIGAALYSSTLFAQRIFPLKARREPKYVYANDESTLAYANATPPYAYAM